MWRVVHVVHAITAKVGRTHRTATRPARTESTAPTATDTRAAAAASTTGRRWCPPPVSARAPMCGGCVLTPFGVYCACASRPGDWAECDDQIHSERVGGQWLKGGHAIMMPRRWPCRRAQATVAPQGRTPLLISQCPLYAEGDVRPSVRRVRSMCFKHTGEPRGLSEVPAFGCPPSHIRSPMPRDAR